MCGKIMKKVPVVNLIKCMKCHTCIEVCPQNVISEALNTCCAKCIKYCIVFPVPCHPGYLIFDYDACDSCGICIDQCPYGAMEWADYETAHLKQIEQL
jgi:Fe-S-cluster-containing hydrogenase component 2